MAIAKINPNSKPTTRELNKLLKEGVIDGWDNGLKEYALNRPLAGEPKFEEYKKKMEDRYEAVATLVNSKKKNSE